MFENLKSTRWLTTNNLKDEFNNINFKTKICILINNNEF